MGKKSLSYVAPAGASFHRPVMVVLQVLRLLKSMRRKCIHPAVVGKEPAHQVLGVEPESDEISTDPRKEQENFNPNEPRHLKLKFSNNMINGPIYTGRPIGGDHVDNTLNVDLVDCRTENIVKYGAEASAKVEIVAVEKEEFKTATSWPDGKSLIQGDPHVSLKDGRVCVSHISFKHTRVSMRKRELRLGARAVYPCHTGTTIIEAAVTQPFFLLDRRCMPKSKRSLNLDDQVWKLPTIGKGGPYHEFLNMESINTVRDFLTHYFLNRENLLNILGRRMKAQKLDATVNQAKGKLDLKRYVYPHENPRVVFTDVGELIGVQLDQEGHFVSVEQLTQTQKDFGMELVKTAFQDGHQNFKVLLDNDSFQMLLSSSSPNNAADQLDGSNNGFTFGAYNYPSDTQQLQSEPHNNANYTSLILNNYDCISQINSSPTGALPHLHPDDDDFNYQDLPASIWD